jgi:hypothetical protein
VIRCLGYLKITNRTPDSSAENAVVVSLWVKQAVYV